MLPKLEDVGLELGNVSSSREQTRSRGASKTTTRYQLDGEVDRGTFGRVVQPGARVNLICGSRKTNNYQTGPHQHRKDHTPASRCARAFQTLLRSRDNTSMSFHAVTVLTGALSPTNLRRSREVAQLCFPKLTQLGCW